MAEEPIPEPPTPGADDASQIAPAPASPGAERHGARSAVVAVVMSLVGLLVMSVDGPWRYSVPVGGVACLIAVIAMLHALHRTTNADPSPSALVQQLVQRDVTRAFVWLVVASATLVIVTSLAVSGAFARVPGFGLSAQLRQAVLAGTCVTTATLWCIAEVFHVFQSLGVYDEKPLRQRSGFWLMLLSVMLYMPMLGNFALIDPWETHYGEVAREMVVRNDWISMWWAHDGWFYSKPVLNFWMQALGFSLFGVKVQAGQMLAGVTSGLVPQPEWAARLPLALMTIATGYGMYRIVRWFTTERVGLLAAIALMTTPYWFFLGHQTMADMPYVAPMTLGMGLLLCALLSDEHQQVRTYQARLFGQSIHVNAYHLVIGAILLIALPQILYLISRNVTLHVFAEDRGFRLHADELMAGSPGNCELSGNEDCHLVKRLAFRNYQPAFLAVAWAALTGLFLRLNRDERRVQRLLYIAAWLCISVAFMAKVAPAVVLPLAAFVAHLVVTRRSGQAKQAEWGSLILLLTILAGPWLAQMYVRHGFPFIDRLFIHDIVKRAFEHVHDTNDGVDTSLRYYVWQLGYGLFPWSGLAFAGLLWWGRAAGREAPSRQYHLVIFCALWFIAGFGMFAVANTKFHHYALPLVPPVAILGALILDQALGRAPRIARSRFAAYLAGLSLGIGAVILGVTRLRPGNLLGSMPGGDPPPPSPLLGWSCIGFGIAVCGITVWLLEKRNAETTEPDVGSNVALGLAGLITGVGALVVGRDLFTSNTADVVGPLRLYHLFCYNYARPWPELLSFEAAIFAFSIVSAGAALLFLFPRIRQHAAVIFCIVGCWWTVWALDVYFVKIAPHFSQRANMIAYYEQREGPDEPLIAYQMNWKGENFYTSNHIETWTKTGQKFKDWVQEQRNAGVKTMFFTTEHSRINTLKRELSHPKNFVLLTDKAFDNKFFVAKVTFEEGD